MSRLPKITKTHRWDRELIAKVESLAERTGRPVQHVLEDAVAIGLEEIEEQIASWMRDLTPAEAWEGFVGNQTPAECWQVSYEQGARTYYEAAERYVRDLPNIVDDWLGREPGDYPDLDKLAFLLADYMEEQGAGIYQAWLGDMLMGEGRTREEAIEAAVREYEAVDEYGEYPRIPSREELISRLDVSLTVREDE